MCRTYRGTAYLFCYELKNKFRNPRCAGFIVLTFYLSCQSFSKGCAVYFWHSRKTDRECAKELEASLKKK